MKHTFLLGLIATLTVSTPVLASKVSNNPLHGLDQATLQAIATQLKADVLAPAANTQSQALQSVESDLDKREAKSEGLAEAKAGFYKRLAGVLAALVTVDLLQLRDARRMPSDNFKCTMMVNAALLAAWAAYECSPLAGRALNYLLATHSEQAA